MKLKDMKRLKQILEAFASKGFSYYLYKSKLHKCVSPVCRAKCWYKGCFCPPEKKSLPVTFRKLLEDLGPTFVKLGQLLSVRPDFIPYEYCEELRKLQDHVPPFSFTKVKKIVETELGKPIPEIFTSFSEKPIASASIAQVHKAKLKNGKSVAVKVQRPDIVPQIEQDLKILSWVAEYLEKRWEVSQPFRPKKMVEEFAEWTERELDFRNEAKSMSEIRDNFGENDKIVIPKVSWDFTTKKVLTMQFLEGKNMYDDKGLKKLKINRKRVAINGSDIMFEQTIVHGVFHGDPHPGNLLVMPGNRLGFLDFGIVGRLPLYSRRKMLLVIHHLVNRDFDRAIDHVVELSETTEDSDLEGFRKWLYKLFSSWYGSTLTQNSLSQVLFKGVTQGVHYKVYFPSDLVLYSKAFVTTESVGRLLYPEFDISKHAKPMVEKVTKSQLSAVKSTKRFIENSLEYSDVVENLPFHMNKLLKKLEEPELKMKLNTEEFHGITDEIHKVNNVRALGVIIASLILSSAIIFYAEGGKQIFGISLGFLFFYVAIILGTIMTVLMLTKKWR